MWTTPTDRVNTLLIRERNAFITKLRAKGFSYSEISLVVKLDKGGISRVVRFGANKRRGVRDTNS